MYEIVLTLRPDFREKPLGRYPTAEEAQEAARAYAAVHREQVIRAWLRTVKNTAAPKSEGNNK